MASGRASRPAEKKTFSFLIVSLSADAFAMTFKVCISTEKFSRTCQSHGSFRLASKKVRVNRHVNALTKKGTKSIFSLNGRYRLILFLTKGMQMEYVSKCSKYSYRNVECIKRHSQQRSRKKRGQYVKVHWSMFRRAFCGIVFFFNDLYLISIAFFRLCLAR